MNFNPPNLTKASESLGFLKKKFIGLKNYLVIYESDERLVL